MVGIWNARLPIIKSALNNFPTLKRLSAITQSSLHFPTITSSYASESGSSKVTPLTPTLHTQVSLRSWHATNQCLKRDQETCLVTGRKSQDGFPLEVIYIIPLAHIKSAEFWKLDFWLILELFFGIECTNGLFHTLLKDINLPTN